jgi:hypothetical protein
VTDRAHGQRQQIESDLRDVNQRGSVLAALEKAEAAKIRIAQTFGQNPARVIVYLGLKRGMTQGEVVQALKDRGLPGASQASVSRAEAALEEAGFLVQPPQGRRQIREGWEEFGLSRVLAKVLKDGGVAKLG